MQLQLGNTDTSARTRPPTISVDGKSKIPPRTAAKRRHETLTHASAIHGGSKNNPDPAFDGMFDTLAKRCKVDKLKDYVLGQKTLKEKVASATFKKNVKALESSAENAKRSIAVFYSSGVMGKRKYKSVRISLSMKINETTKGRSAIIVTPKCPIPKLLPYDKLVKEINQIDIGNVYRLDEEFQGAIGDELTQGCFRRLVECLPRLAKFYLRKDRKEALQWFGKTEGDSLPPVKERNRAQTSAAICLWRSRGQLCIREENGKEVLFYRNLRVLRSSEVNHVVADEFHFTKGSGATMIVCSLKEHFVGLSKNRVQDILNKDKRTNCITTEMLDV